MVRCEVLCCAMRWFGVVHCGAFRANRLSIDSCTDIVSAYAFTTASVTRLGRRQFIVVFCCAVGAIVAGLQVPPQTRAQGKHYHFDSSSSAPAGAGMCLWCHGAALPRLHFCMFRLRPRDRRPSHWQAVGWVKNAFAGIRLAG